MNHRIVTFVFAQSSRLTAKSRAAWPGIRLLAGMVLAAAVPAGAMDFSWMNAVAAGDIAGKAHAFEKRDREAGAMWMKSAGKEAAGNPAFTAHVPWKGAQGVVFADFPVSIPAGGHPALRGEAALTSAGGDGVGLSVMIVDDGVLHFSGHYAVAPDKTEHAFAADLTKWAGRAVTLRLQLDPEKTSYADTTRISGLHIVTDGREAPIQGLGGDFKTAWISLTDLSDMELARKRPKDDSIMNRYLQGRQPGANVYSRQDSYRPMIGAHVYLTPEALKYLPYLTDVFDFAAHDAGEKGNVLMEENGIPWIRVIQNAIPLGSWDTKRLKRLADAVKGLENYGKRYRFNLGVTSGSEPHISPDFHYTGHTQEEVESMPNTPGSSRDFGAWLANLYGDSSPSVDSNGDGITFKSDFGFTADSWAKLGLAVPKDKNDDVAFLKTLNREHIIADDITRIDGTYHQSGLVVTSRLLSPQYPPVFGQSLRQLRLPTGGTGVTYYTHKGLTLDPEATQASFGRDRIYKSEKTYESVLSIRPPFRGGTGACIGVFGPYKGQRRFEAELRAGFDRGESPLVVTFEQVETGDPIAVTALRKEAVRVAAGATVSSSFESALTAKDWYIRITCRSQNRGTGNTKVFIKSSLIGKNGARHALADDYYNASLWQVLDSQPRHPIDMGHAKTVYNPAVTELRGCYIWEQAKLHNQRVVYNEFQTGNADGNTTANVYRGVFHELQFKPAVINWFCYGGGSPYARFAWMDVHYLATELAVLRGQLELMRPYPEIDRVKRPLAVFLPPAAPAPVGEGYKRKDLLLAGALESFGPDVFLSDQLDKYADYQNIILVLGYIDGKTDRFLTDFLRKLPRGKKVMILCESDRLYCDPGRRASRDFRQSLKDVLPLSPVGGGMDEEKVSLNPALGLSVELAESVARNPAYAAGQWIQAGKHTAGWRGNNLLMLAGVPISGLDKLIPDFFGIHAPTLREAGKLKILNRDAIAKEAGWYCLDTGPKLTLKAGLVGYDLVNRVPFRGGIGGPSVVSVFNGKSFEVLDAGTAPVELVTKTPDRVVVRARPPRYPFEGKAKPELVVYSDETPAVSCDGVSLEVTPMKDHGFYKVPVTQAGEYILKIKNKP